jgi:hypothetical protein
MYCCDSELFLNILNHRMMYINPIFSVMYLLINNRTVLIQGNLMNRIVLIFDIYILCIIGLFHDISLEAMMFGIMFYILSHKYVLLPCYLLQCKLQLEASVSSSKPVHNNYPVLIRPYRYIQVWAK